MQKGSYETINYSLRPAKNIERKMLCEVMLRLSLIQSIQKYRYIGMGSTYFSDFNIIHKLLGIKDLISIEKDIFNSERFNFNKPYSCIDMIFDETSNVIQNNDWNKRCIVWLDYDGKLNKKNMDDIDTFFNSAKAGSLFIISVNVHPDKFIIDNEEESIEFNIPLEKLKKYRIEKLIERVGQTNVPIDLNEKNLSKKENPKVIYQIINDKIEETLSKRNGGLSKKQKIIYDQLFNFVYQDGALMLTVGGIIYNTEQSTLIKKMNFKELKFTRSGIDNFEINVPKLTFKEINFLNSLLPSEINLSTGKVKRNRKPKVCLNFIPNEDIRNYLKIYRYFPNFAEANL